MKKLISILLAVVMLASFMVTAAFAAEPEEVTTSALVGTGKVTGETGGEVTVQVWVDDVKVNDVAGYRSFLITCGYDATALELVRVNGNVTANTKTPGTVIVSFASATLVELGGAENSFSMTFKILAGPGEYPVDTTVLELFGNNGVKVTPDSVSDGSVTVLCPHVNTETKIENRVEATCGADGSYDEVVYCKDCGTELSRTKKTIPATGNHTADAAVRENEKAATCGEAGSYDEVVYCSVCEEELSRTNKTIPATGDHTPGAAVRENEKAATCADAGSYDEVIYCSVCEEELSRTAKTIPATGEHTPEVIPGKAATCTATGLTEGSKCSVCGETIKAQEVIEKLGHTPEVIPGKAATCTSTGLTEGSKCSVCGEILVAQEVIAKLAHEEDYEPNKNGTHKVICKNCDTVLDSDEKCFDVNPKDGKCDGCGEKIPEEPTKPTTKPTEDDDEDDDVPKTGDITPYPVYFLIAMMAVAATAYGLKRKFDV